MYGQGMPPPSLLVVVGMPPPQLAQPACLASITLKRPCIGVWAQKGMATAPPPTKHAILHFVHFILLPHLVHERLVELLGLKGWQCGMQDAGQQVLPRLHLCVHWHTCVGAAAAAWLACHASAPLCAGPWSALRGSNRYT